MGMGDCVLEILLREKGILDGDIATRDLDFFVICLDKDLRSTAVEIVAQLRQRGFSTDFSYKAGSLKKQLKLASAANSTRCIIIGEEFMGKNNELVIKDMDSGEQELVEVAKFFAQL